METNQNVTTAETTVETTTPAAQEQPSGESAAQPVGAAASSPSQDGASQDPADSHVHHIPSLMLLTLLPFKGGIVTDGKTIHLSPRPAPWALPLIAEQLRDLCTLPIVETSEQLVAYASEIPDGENRLSRSFQKEVDRGFASGLLA